MKLCKRWGTNKYPPCYSWTYVVHSDIPGSLGLLRSRGVLDAYFGKVRPSKIC